MIDSRQAKERDEALVHVLGYMHLSSGRRDPKLYAAMNRLYGLALESSSDAARPYTGMPAWLTIQQWLQDRLTLLAESQAAFREHSQAADVLSTVWLELLPAYLDFHRDSLFHQEPEGLFNGFFLAQAVEVVLGVGLGATGGEGVVAESIRQLNSYVGYRPVAMLEKERCEPYPHEWVCPVPLYIQDVGVSEGPYREVIARAMDILQATDPAVCREAAFELSRLRELSFDPRAYDFDHPVNRRPNYQFGTWDMSSISPDGFYDRFVMQQFTLDALLARPQAHPELPADELLTEAATVLAGTVLMASGITGWGPGAYDSTVTLTSLMQPIAAYRDQFYSGVLSRMSGPHAERLRDEQSRRRQPFGGARQHLNSHLARSRASQLAHVQLARLFARMGSGESAKSEADAVQVASARMTCRIDCLLVAGQHLLRTGESAKAAKLSTDILDLLHRAVECGALVDPWNILGFAGNFPYFPSPEAACDDHRLEHLNDLLERIAAYFSRVWREAAAADDAALAASIDASFKALAEWWHQFASEGIEDLEMISLQDSYQSAELVASALRLWHAGGAASGDVRFWAGHAELFDSPRAYMLVLEALLERRDFVASQALLIHWLSEATRTGLRSGETSFADLAQRWFYRLDRASRPATTAEATSASPPIPVAERWRLTKRFFDVAEANAEQFWRPPVFLLAAGGGGRPTDDPSADWTGDEPPPGDAAESSDEEEETFAAAYEGVVFQDSTDDGHEGAVFEPESETHDELLAESRRLEEHLEFLVAIAKMWKATALQTCADRRERDCDLAAIDRRLDSLKQWSAEAGKNLRGTLRLIGQIRTFRVRKGGSDQESMSQYDRKRMIKESLLERTIHTALEIADGRRMLLAAILAIDPDRQKASAADSEDLSGNDWRVVELYCSLLGGDRGAVESRFNAFLQEIQNEKLLYVPLSRGGDPVEIFRVRLRRRSLTHLLLWLPRQGLFLAACRLIETARRMEHQNPVGPGAVTEFDELYQIAFTAMARALVRNAYAFRPNNGVEPPMELEDIVELQINEPAVPRLLGLFERLTEVLLHSWLQHSRTLRLSVLETIDSPAAWGELVDFIKRFGRGLFTQSFLKLANVRAILHQGVSQWLSDAAEDPDEELRPLMAAIESGELSTERAAASISLVFEAVMDHYAEYRDYNSTTTQSDRGEMTYMLLDFLRLRVRYDRVSWNLKPVFIAHEVLVRHGCTQTAQQWRRALAERVGREANQYTSELHKLQEKYAMQMPSVADRLAERFMKPMSIGRMRALIRPAIRQLQTAGKRVSSAFELLLQEAQLIMREPSGVGFDTPEWLSALHEEVDQVRDEDVSLAKSMAFERAVAFVPLRASEIESQLDAFERQNRTRKLP